MTSPLVAVPGYHLKPGRVERWAHGAYAVPDHYVAAIVRAGMRAAILTGPADGEPERVLRRFDGLVLIGGGDVDPARYGAERAPETYGIDPERDALEIELVLAAAELDVPCLAICRGPQLLNVAFGGTLHQHVGNLPNAVAHGVP